MIEPRVEFAYEAVARLGPPVDQGLAPDGQRRQYRYWVGRSRGRCCAAIFLAAARIGR